MSKINFLTYLTNFQYFCWRCSWLIEYLILNIEKKILFYKCPMIQLISNSIFPRYPFLKKCCKDNEWLVWRTYSQCGNYENLLSPFFDKNFVKGTPSLEKLLKSWFHEIFFVRVYFPFFHTVATQQSLSNLKIVEIVYFSVVTVVFTMFFSYHKSFNFFTL